VKAEIELLAAFTFDLSCFWEGDQLVGSAYQRVENLQVFGEHNALFVILSNVPARHAEIQKWAQTWGIAADTFSEWSSLIHTLRAQVLAWQKGQPIPTPLSALSNLPAKISFASIDTGYKIQIVLQSLGDLLYTQCILAISRGAKLEHCQVCGRPFLQFPPFTRATRIYCSRKCNQVAYRARQDQKDTKHATSKKRKPQTKGARGRRSPKDK
jgi:hypothetical protein